MKTRYLLKQARKDPELFRRRAVEMREACEYADIDRSEAPRLLADQYRDGNRPNRGYMSERVKNGIVTAGKIGVVLASIHYGMHMGVPTLEKFAYGVGGATLAIYPFLLLQRSKPRSSNIDWSKVLNAGSWNKEIVHNGEISTAGNRITVNLEDLTAYNGARIV